MDFISILLILGLLWVVAGLTKTTGFNFKSENAYIQRFLCAGFFLFGMLHLVLAIFLSQAPVPFGSPTNETWTSQVNSTPFIFNSTTYTYNSTGSLTGTQIIGNVVTNQTITKTGIISYNVFGNELISFLSYTYVLVLVFYLVIWAFAFWNKANAKMSGRSEDDEEEQ